MKRRLTVVNRYARIIAILACILLPLGKSAFSQSRNLPDATQAEQTINEAKNNIAFIENKGQWPSHVLDRKSVV